jgi:DNA mismatch repair protein MutS
MTKRANDPDLMLAQYAELKRRDPEAILLFRVEDSQVGDSYTVLGEDIQALYDVAKRVLRDTHFIMTHTRIIFAASSLEAVLARIVAAGKRAAVCEQVTETKAIKAASRPDCKPVERIVMPGRIAEPPSHRITLGHPFEDAGIWLECSCGYRENLGFEQTLPTVVAAAQAHRQA